MAWSFLKKLGFRSLLENSAAHGLHPLDSFRPLFDRLDRHSQTLTGISQSTEKVFLDVATILEKVFTDVQGINVKSDHILKLESSQEDPANILTATTDLVRGTIDVVVQVTAESAGVVDRLKKVEGILDQLLKHESGLKSAIAPFTIIQMLFKIHSASLTEEQRTVFYGISDQLYKIDQKIREIFATQFTNLNIAKETIRKLLLEIQIQVDSSQKMALQNQQQMDQTLMLLEQQIEENRHQNFKLNHHTSSLQKEASQLVMAMQYHDITHQRLQHVCQAIQEMKGEYIKLSGSSSSSSFAEFSAYLKGAVGIQKKQIDSLLEGIQEAETKMKGGVTNLLTTSKAVASEAMRLEDISNSGSSIDGVVQSLLDLMEGLPHQLNQAHEISVRMDQMIQPVTATVSNLTGVLNSISIEMRLIALNSQVQAAQIQQGTGLDHLSAQTCSLSDQILVMNQELSGGLEELVQEFKSITDCLTKSIQVTEGRKVFVSQEGAGNEKGLHALRDKSLGLLMEICEVDTGIQKNGEELLSRLAFGRELAEACQPLYEMMDQMMPMTLSHGGGEAGSQEAEARLNRLRQNYTMQEEHEIHQEALKGDCADSTSAKKESMEIDFFGEETPAVAVTPATAPSAVIDIDFFDEPNPASAPEVAAGSEAAGSGFREMSSFAEEKPLPKIEVEKKPEISKKELDSNIELF